MAISVAKLYKCVINVMMCWEGHPWFGMISTCSAEFWTHWWLSVWVTQLGKPLAFISTHCICVCVWWLTDRVWCYPDCIECVTLSDVSLSMFRVTDCVLWPSANTLTLTLSLSEYVCMSLCIVSHVFVTVFTICRRHFRAFSLILLILFVTSCPHVHYAWP